jgi:hypothetical protein
LPTYAISVLRSLTRRCCIGRQLHAKKFAGAEPGAEERDRSRTTSRGSTAAAQILDTVDRRWAPAIRPAAKNNSFLI